MSWFDEQIRDRKQKDQEVFEDAMLKMASVIAGGSARRFAAEDRYITKDAIDDILKYYHYKPAEIPGSIKDPEEQLEYAMRPHGLMNRMVELKEEWYRDAWGPMILFRKEDGMALAAFPKAVRGYYYRDSYGRKVTINRQEADLFDTEAYCFYRPFPLEPIGAAGLFSYMKGCISAFDIGYMVVLSLLSTLVGMFLPRITRFLTGYVLDMGIESVLWGTAGFIVCVALSMQLIQGVMQLVTERIELKTQTSVQAASMMRVLSLPASFFAGYSSGDLASRSESLTQLCMLLVENVFSMSLVSVSSLLYISQIFQFAPGLALPAIIIIAATVLVNILTTLIQARITKQQMEYSAKERGISFALINGVQKIKLAGAEKRAFVQWADAYTKGASLLYNPPLFLKINAALTTAVSLAGTLVLYWLAVKTGVGPSEYIAFNAAYGTVLGAFLALSGVAASVSQIKPILDMADPILKARPEVSEGREILTRISGRIELNNVSFRYHEHMPYVLDGLNLKIRPGEYIAIVGRTGCGKSTLMRLLLGFESPDKGAIYYDGKDMNKIDLRSLRRKIGAVTQDGALFSGSIYTNIVISAPQLSRDEAWEAAETAGIAEDIRQMPMGMETMISEGQGGISGGQKQRLMIARAIAPKPRILMFDEATSALDNRTQQQVSEALDRLKCTRIVIAHRLSTIKNCDRILVLDQGKIIEEGSYDDLIAMDGYFADLVARQRLDA